MFIRTRLAQWLTFGFASGITLYPFVLIAPKANLSRRLVIHERIHLKQQAELLILPFYFLYLMEYLCRYLRYKNHYHAYRTISFEQEAYGNDANGGYLNSRPFWNWVNYLK